MYIAYYIKNSRSFFKTILVILQTSLFKKSVPVKNHYGNVAEKWTYICNEIFDEVSNLIN